MFKKAITYLTIFFIFSLGYITSCLLFCSLSASLNSPGWVSLFYQFAIAYVITYGFYMITIYLKERRNTANINEYVIPRSTNIIGDGYVIFNALAIKGGVPNASFPPSKEELKSILGKVNPKINDAPMINLDGTHLTWPQYLNDRRMRSQDFIKKILDRMPYLNTDLVRIITRIDDCGYFFQLPMLVSTPMRNADMSFISDSLFTYFNEIDNLSKFMRSEYGKSISYSNLFQSN